MVIVLVVNYIAVTGNALTGFGAGNALIKVMDGRGVGNLHVTGGTFAGNNKVDNAAGVVFVMAVKAAIHTVVGVIRGSGSTQAERLATYLTGVGLRVVVGRVSRAGLATDVTQVQRGGAIGVGETRSNGIVNTGLACGTVSVNNAVVAGDVAVTGIFGTFTNRHRTTIKHMVTVSSGSTVACAAFCFGVIVKYFVVKTNGLICRRRRYGGPYETSAQQGNTCNSYDQDFFHFFAPV